MRIIEVIYPGVSFFCFLALLFLSILQYRIYYQFGFSRSKYIAIFCFLTSIYTVNVTIVYTELLSISATRFFVVGLQFILFAGYYYYLKSLSFFIMIPGKLKKIYFRSMKVFILLSFIPPIAMYGFNIHLYFDPSNKVETGRFFLDAYSTRLGMPYKAPLIVLSLFAVLNVFMSLFLLNRLRKSSQDIFLALGLSFNLIAFGMDYLILPLTVRYYVPVLFLSNIFEAFRMCTLTSREVALKSLETSEESKEESTKNDELEEERMALLGTKLLHYMEDEKLFLNPNLRIEDLARKLRIPNYLVSQVIRFSLNKTFSQLLMEYRIGEAKNRLLSDLNREKTILEIAQDSGFNSKSSFNALFKKQVGQTPSEFRSQKELK